MLTKFFFSRYYHLSPDALTALGFSEFARFSHDQVGTVVLSFLKHNSPWRNVYIFCNLAVALGYLYRVLSNDYDYEKLSAGVWFIIGMAAFFPLIPLHEGLHLMAYRLAGAHKLFVKAHWKKGYFLAGAPNFVADARSFHFVAFLPFIVITALHLLVIFTFKAEWTTLFWGSLLMHTLGCLGDFAMVNFLGNIKEGEAVTYDTDDGYTVFMVRAYRDTFKTG